VLILKSFKSFVSEVRIPKELRVCFAEVRILKGLAAFRRLERKQEDTGFNTEGTEFTEIAEKMTALERIDDRVGGNDVQSEANMRKGTTMLARA